MVKLRLEGERLGKRHNYDADDLSPLLRFLAWVLRSYFLFVERTTQVLVAGDGPFNKVQVTKQPAIIVIWHGRNFQAIPVGRFMSRPISVLTSRSRDGAMIANIVRPFGFKSVQGSGTGRAAGKATKPSKRGMQAFRNMLRLLKQNEMVLATADVPPGPVFETGPGMVKLAQRSGAAIIPIGVSYSPQLPIAGTWDHMHLPLPFGRRAFAFGAPVYVPATANADQLAAAQKQVDAALNAAQALAQSMLGQKTD